MKSGASIPLQSVPIFILYIHFFLNLPNEIQTITLRYSNDNF